MTLDEVGLGELVKKLQTAHTLDIRDIVRVRALLDLVAVERSQAADALTSLIAERDGLRTTRDAARENFLTMQGAAAQLLKRAEAAESQLKTAREALDRQCDNMSFVLNRVNLHGWHDKFSRELTEDRLALSNITEAKNG